MRVAVPQPAARAGTSYDTSPPMSPISDSEFEHRETDAVLSDAPSCTLLEFARIYDFI